MPPGVLCGAVQELHSCLIPLLKWGDLLDLKMLDMAKKDPIPSHVHMGEASSPEPRAEEPISIPASDEMLASESQEAAHPEELTTGTSWVYLFMGR